VGTIIAFRVGPLDAELLETIFTPQFLAADIVNLSFAQVYLTLMIDGIGSQPFSAKTLAPIEPPSSSCKEMAIAESRLRFTRPRAEVEIEIHKFHEPVVVPKKVVKPIIPERVIANGEAARAQGEAPAPVIKREVAPVAKPEVHGEHTPQRSVERRSEVPQRRSTDVPRKHSEDRPRTEVPRAPQVRREAPKQNAEDLKSILKRIVKTTEEGNDKESAEKKQTEKIELKEAITSVISQPVPQVHKNPVSVPAPAPVTAPHMEKKPPQKVEPPVVKDAITPKELERMMRVTTSDKPPV
jgi:hypothetical protein